MSLEKLRLYYRSMGVNGPMATALLEAIEIADSRARKATQLLWLSIAITVVDVMLAVRVIL